MSWMMERKAKALFEEYKAAELAGEDSKAAELEAKLNDGGWKITHGPDGWTVIKEENNFTETISGYLPRHTPVNPYKENNTGMGLGGMVLIGAGALLMILAIIAVVQQIKKKNSHVYTQL